MWLKSITANWRQLAELAFSLVSNFEKGLNMSRETLNQLIGALEDCHNDCTYAIVNMMEPEIKTGSIHFAGCEEFSSPVCIGCVGAWVNRAMGNPPESYYYDGLAQLAETIVDWESGDLDGDETAADILERKILHKQINWPCDTIGHSMRTDGNFWGQSGDTFALSDLIRFLRKVDSLNPKTPAGWQSV